MPSLGFVEIVAPVLPVLSRFNTPFETVTFDGSVATPFITPPGENQSGLHWLVLSELPLNVESNTELHEPEPGTSPSGCVELLAAGLVPGGGVGAELVPDGVEAAAPPWAASV